MKKEDVEKIADRICKEVLGVEPGGRWRVKQTSQDVWHAEAGSVLVVIDFSSLRFTAIDHLGDAKGEGSIKWSILPDSGSTSQGFAA